MSTLPAASGSLTMSPGSSPITASSASASWSWALSLPGRGLCFFRVVGFVYRVTADALLVAGVSRVIGFVFRVIDENGKEIVRCGAGENPWAA